jgi:hypothetical protein
MKILAIEREVPGIRTRRGLRRTLCVAGDAFEPHLQAEAAKVWELYQAGVIREIYFRRDRPDAVLVLECADVEEARGVLHTLPLMKEGLIAFEIIPLGPYPGFARLFGDAKGSPGDETKSSLEG